MAKLMPALTDAQLARFWAKIDVRGKDECWPWTGYKSVHGYGRFSISSSMYLAPRVALHISGVNPDAHHVLHNCDNPPCCNPSHLRLGTQSENMNDMISRGRNNPIRGGVNAVSKLTAEKVTRIKSDNRTLRAIAADYGVSSVAIYRIKSGATWKHVF